MAAASPSAGGGMDGDVRDAQGCVLDSASFKFRREGAPDALFATDRILGQGKFTKVWKAVPLVGSAGERPGFPGFSGENSAGATKTATGKPLPAGPKVAMKVYSKGRLKERGALRTCKDEVLSMACLTAPLRPLPGLADGLGHVAQLIDTFESHRGVHIVMELGMGGSLFAFLRKVHHLPLAMARVVFRQVALGVYYAHACGIAHRNVKAENILLANAEREGQALDTKYRHDQLLHDVSPPVGPDGEELSLPPDLAGRCVKLGDFGTATRVDIPSGNPLTTPAGELTLRHRRFKQRVGSPEYMAPEVIEPPYGDYGGYPVDVWSMGVLLWVMLTGKYPFKGASAQALMQQVLKHTPEWDRHTSPACIGRAVEWAHVRTPGGRPDLPVGIPESLQPRPKASAAPTVAHIGGKGRRGVDVEITYDSDSESDEEGGADTLSSIVKGARSAAESGLGGQLSFDREPDGEGEADEPAAGAGAGPGAQEAAALQARRKAASKQRPVTFNTVPLEPWPTALVHLMMGMLNRDADARLTAQQVFLHPWVQGRDFLPTDKPPARDATVTSDELDFEHTKARTDHRGTASAAKPVAAASAQASSASHSGDALRAAMAAARAEESAAAGTVKAADLLKSLGVDEEASSTSSGRSKGTGGLTAKLGKPLKGSASTPAVQDTSTPGAVKASDLIAQLKADKGRKGGGRPPAAAAGGGGGGGMRRVASHTAGSSSSKGSEEGGPVKAADLLKSLGADKRGGKGMGGRKGKGLTAKLGKPLEGSSSMTASVDSGESGSSAVKADALISKLKGDKGRKGGKGSPRSGKPPAAAGGGGSGGMRRVASHTAGSSSKGGESSGPVKAADLLKSLGAGKPRPKRRSEGRPPVPRPSGASASTAAAAASGGGLGTARDPEAEARAGILERLKASARAGGGEGTIKADVLLRRLGSKAVMSSSMHAGSSKSGGVGGDSASVGAGKADLEVEGALSVEDADDGSESSSTAHMGRPGAPHEDETQSAVSAEDRSAIIGRLLASDRTATRAASGAVRADTLLRKLGSMRLDDGSSVGGDSTGGSVPRVISDVGSAALALAASKEAASKETLRAVALERIRQAREAGDREGAVKAEELLERLKRTGSMRSTGSSRSGVEPTLYNTGDAGAVGGGDGRSYIQKAMAAGRAADAEQGSGTVKAADLLARLRKEGRGRGKRRGVPEMQILRNEEDVEAAVGAEAYASLMQRLKDASKEGSTGTVPAAELLAALQGGRGGKAMPRGGSMRTPGKSRAQQAAVGSSSGLTPGEARSAILQQLKQSPRRPSSGAVPAEELIAALMPKSGKARSARAPHARSASDGSASVDKGSSSDKSSGRGSKATGGMGGAVARQHGGAVPASELIASLSRDKKVKRTMSMRAAQKGKEKWEILHGDAGAPAAAAAGATPEEMRAALIERLKHTAAEGNREGTVKAEELISRLKRTGSMRSTGSGGGVSGHSRKPSLDVEGAIAALGLTDAQEATLRLELAKAAEGKGRGMKRITSGVFFSTLAASRMKLGLKRVGSGKAGSPRAALGRALPPRPKGSEAGRDAPAPVPADQLIAKLGSRRLDRGGSKLAMEDLEAFAEEASSARDDTLDTLDDHVDALVDDGDLDGEDEESEGRSAGVPGAEQDTDSAPSAQAAPQEQATEPAGDAHPAMARLPSMVIRSKRKARSVRDLLAKARAEEASKENKSGSVAGDSLSASEGSGEAAGDGGSEAGQSAATSVPPQPLDLHRVDDTELALSEAGSDASKDSLPLAAPFHVMSPVAEGGETESPSRPGSRGGGQLEAFPVSGRRSRLSSSPLRPPRQSGEQTSDESGGQPVKLSGSSSDADGAIGAEDPAAGASEQGADSPLAPSPEQAETDAVSSGEGQASTAGNADKQGGAEEEGEASTTPRPLSRDGRDSGAASARSGRAGEVKPMHKGVDLLAMAPQLKLRRNVQDEPSRRYSDVFGPPRLSTHRPSPTAAAGAAAGDEDGHGGHTGGRGESSGEGAPPRPRHNFGIVTHQEMEQLRAASDVSSSEETPSVVEAIARQRAHARTMSDAEWQAKRTEQFRNKRMSRAALLSVKSFAAGAGRVGSFSRHGSMPGMALGGLGGFSAADVLAAAAAQEAARVRGDEGAEGSSPGPTAGEEASATGSGEAAGVVVEHSVERMRVRHRKHARATRNVSRMATKVSAAMRLFSPKRTPDTAGSPEAFAVGGAFQGIAMRRPGGATATLDASPPQESKASDTRSSTLTSADGVGVHSFAHSRDLQGGQSTQGSKSDERGGSTASTDLLPLAGVTRVESAAGLSGVETASLASGTDVGRWPSSTVRPQSSDASDDRPATPPTQQPERLSQQLHGHLPPPVQTTVERQVRGRQSPTNLMSTASRDTSEGVESPVKVVRGAGEEGLELGDLPLDTPMAPAGPLGDSSSTGSLPMPDDQASGRHSASAAHLPGAQLEGAAAAPAQGAFASDEPTVAQRVAATHSLAVPGVRSPAPTRQAVLRGSSRSPASPTASEGSASAPEGILGFSARIGGAEAVSSKSPTHTSPRRELLVRPDSPDSLDEVQRPGPGPWAGSSAEELQLQTQHRVPHAPGETLQSLIIAPSPGPASRTRRTATELVSPASRKPHPPLTSPDTPGTGLRQSTGSETPGLRPVPQTGASPRTHKVDAGGELHGVPSDSSLVPGPLGSDPSRWHGVPAGGGSPLPPKAYDFQTVLEPAFAEGFSLTAQGPPPATNATLSQRRHVVPPASPARVGSALGGGGREPSATHGPRKGAGLPPPSPASPRPTPLISPSRSSQTIQPQGGPHLDLALVATVPFAGASPRQESKAAPNSSLRDVVRQTRTPGARGPSVAFSMMSHGTLQTMMAADTTASPRGSADTRSYHDSPAVVFSADGSSAVVSVRRDAISGSQLLGPSAATQPAGAGVRGDAAEVHGGLDPLVALPRSALAQASPTASTEHLHIRAGKAGPHHAPAPTTPPGQATRAAPAVSARGRLEGSHSARSLRQAAAHMPFPVPATSRKAPREEAARAPPLRSHKQAFSAQGRGSAAVAQLGQSHSRSEFADAALLQLDLAASISPRGPAARSRAVGSNTLALAAKRSMASGASGSGRRSRRRKRQR